MRGEKKAKKGRVLPCLRKCLSEGGGEEEDVPVRGAACVTLGPARRVWHSGVRSLLCDWPGLPRLRATPGTESQPRQQLLPHSPKQVCNLFCPADLHPFCPVETRSVRTCCRNLSGPGAASPAEENLLVNGRTVVQTELPPKKTKTTNKRHEQTQK